MYTLENTTSTADDAVRVSSSAGDDSGQLTILCERLLRAQPQSESLLKRLLARSHGAGNHRAFAPIQDGRCSACNMTVAIARIQRAKAGEFINCANCMTFLYYDQR
jgi:hypothetical protein